MYNIVIINSDEESAAIIKTCIESGEYNVLTASTGKEGLDILNSLIPDLIILNSCLTDMDGLNVLRNIKYDNAISGVPVILTYCEDMQYNTVATLEFGAADFIKMPYDLQEIEAKVKNLIGCITVRAENAQQKTEDAYTIDDSVIERDYAIGSNIIVRLRDNEVKVADETFVLGKKEFNILSDIIKSGNNISQQSDIPESLKMILGYDVESKHNDIEEYAD